MATLVLVFRGGPALERVAVPSLPTEFIKFTAVPAQTGEKEYGVPTSVSIAQAILESNWAQSVLTKEGNAFFGIKCGDNNGPYAIGCLKKTTAECDMTGACHDEIASFRAYSTPADSFRDHGSFLASNKRYTNAFAYTKDADQFTREIATAGYATDPDYAAKIIALMQQYNLYQYNGAP